MGEKCFPRFRGEGLWCPVVAAAVKLRELYEKGIPVKKTKVKTKGGKKGGGEGVCVGKFIVSVLLENFKELDKKAENGVAFASMFTHTDILEEACPTPPDLPFSREFREDALYSFNQDAFFLCLHQLLYQFAKEDNLYSQYSTHITSCLPLPLRTAPQGKRNALHLACMSANFGAVMNLLGESQAESLLNSLRCQMTISTDVWDEYFLTPLHWACFAGGVEIIGLLLNKEMMAEGEVGRGGGGEGGEGRGRGEGVTPLHAICHSWEKYSLIDFEGVLRKLCRVGGGKGGRGGEGMNVRDWEERTPLMYLLEMGGGREYVAALMRAGADPLVKDGRGVMAFVKGVQARLGEGGLEELVGGMEAGVLFGLLPTLEGGALEKLLEDRGVRERVRRGRTKRGETALMVYARVKKPCAPLSLFLQGMMGEEEEGEEGKKWMGEVDGRRLSALHYGAMNGGWEGLMSLLEKGGEEAKRGAGGGELALHYLCGRSWKEEEIEVFFFQVFIYFLLTFLLFHPSPHPGIHQSPRLAPLKQHRHQYKNNAWLHPSPLCLQI